MLSDSGLVTLSVAEVDPVLNTVGESLTITVMDGTGDPTGTAAALMAAHEADTTDAHSIAGITGLQAALDAAGSVDSVNGETGVVVLTASDITSSATGGISATTVQAAIAELESEKAATGHTHAYDPAGTAAAAVAALGDLATQAELDAHASDTTNVHGIADTSLLSLTSHNHTGTYDPAGTAAGAVAALGDLATQAELDAHAADTTSVHGITDTANLARLDMDQEFTGGATFSGTTPGGDAVELRASDPDWPVLAFRYNAGELDESVSQLYFDPDQSRLGTNNAFEAFGGLYDSSGQVYSSGNPPPADSAAAAHIADATAAHAATAIAFTPAGTIAATTVQAAIEEVAAEAGGGFSQSYVGTNSVGGTWEAGVIRTVYLKKITVPSGGRLLADIQAHLRSAAGGQVGGVAFGLYADNGGAPREFLGHGPLAVNDSVLMSTSASAGLGRWLGAGFSRWLDAGDWWIGVYIVDTTGIEIATVTTGGTDRTYQAGGTWQTDAGFTTVTTTVKDYSIRASLIG